MNFIIIDDSKIDCFIAEKVIESSGLSLSCRTFQQGTDALDHIMNEAEWSVSTMILVDDHMPSMNGMDFVKSFEELKIENKKDYHIYILSSSMTEGTPAVKKHALVKGFISKPLKLKTIYNLFRHDLKCIPNERLNV